MRNVTWAVALAGLAAWAVAPAASAGEKAAKAGLSGDYVEARTASVFAGACHFNGELTTTGRDAEIVWHVRTGSSAGVDLAGLTAVAAVTSSENLKNESAPRKAMLFIDDRATPAQAAAMADLLTSRYKGALGQVVAVKRTPVTFSRRGDSFQMTAKGVGTLAVDAMPNHECCKQPNLVWYQPLVEIEGRRVGFTRESGVEDATLGSAWSKSNQNTAFYGTFSTK
jgi:hypothetical protein